ncbi:MAG: transporter substrate-binding domain-containing protein [Pseudomonadota bacterium]
MSFRRLLALIAGIALSLCPSLSFAGNKTITVAADTWCPYNCDEQSREPGFMIDITREILAASGYTVNYKNQSWASAMTDVASGKIDAVVGAGESEARALVLAAEPLGENNTCYYTRSDDLFKFKVGVPLSTRRVGVISGYLYGDPLDQYISANRANYNLVQLVTGDKPLLQNIRKLKARRIDTLVENMVVMDFSTRKYKVDGIRLAGCEGPVPLYIAFSPKREDAGHLAELMNQGIRDMRKKGRINEIMARYGLKDWK